MDQLCKEILEKLSIYERSYTRYTQCLCRRREILISNKPEEKIRQIFLYFLINQSDLSPNLINLKVEHNNLDIAIYKNSEFEDFKPFQFPLAIIEVKREEENLQDHENQLLRYLHEQRSSIGILFNGNSLTLFEKSKEGASFAKRYLSSIQDVPSVLREALGQPSTDRLEFDKAREGDVESFIYLAKKYGKHTLHKFSFLLKNDSNKILGYCFKCDQDYVYYDICGKYSHKNKKRFSFKCQDFDRLISISY